MPPVLLEFFISTAGFDDRRIKLGPNIDLKGDNYEHRY